MSPIRTASQSIRTRMFALLRNAGRTSGAPRLEADWIVNDSRFERLEDRVLLSDADPNFSQVFGPQALTPTPITINAGTGVGTSPAGSGHSTIDVAGDDDVFAFTAPANANFVTIWGDALNAGSTLDSRVEVYTGTVGGSATLIASGSSQGALTSGTLTDGWTSFIATPNTQYFVVVKSDNASGAGSLGDYILRVDAIATAFPTLDPTAGDASIGGSVTIRGGDTVYKVVTGSNAAFNGVGTILVQSTVFTDLDPRVDVYNAQGQRIAFDSDSGNLTDSYLAMPTAANTTYYLRIRSDEFLPDSNQHPSLGTYTVIFDGIGRSTVVDPVTRLGTTGTRSVATQKDIDFFRFQAQGTGLSFITVNIGIPFGMPDSAVRLYDGTGAQIGFNELTGPFSRLQIQLVGGQTYFCVVENFDGTGGGLYIGELEAHHTYVPAEPVDDHQTTPNYNAGSPPAFGTQAYIDLQRQFEEATPIIWSAPQDATTPGFPGLPAVATPDHSSVIVGTATGRIHAPGDTDLFQFVVPVDMLGAFGGRSTRDNTPPPPPGGALWRPNYRPATSIQILAQAETLFDAQVRIIDSNFQQVYPNGGTNNNVLTGPFATDPAGALDPASFPPELGVPIYGYTFAGGQPARIDIWAGEVYYLEISGAGSGRYDVQLQTDAQTDNVAVSTFGPRVADAGDFANAPEIQIDPNTGEGTNYINAAGSQVIALPDGSFIAAPPGVGTSGVNLGRTYAANLNGPPQTAPLTSVGTGATVIGPLHGTPGTRGRVIFQISDLGIIQTPQDTDLYQFRALYSGTAEVRLATTQITDEYFEDVVQTEAGDLFAVPPGMPHIETAVTKTKTYNSPLDGALRIFDNDQTQIAYNNDNDVTGGEMDARNVGSLGFNFNRLDPRVVFPVEAGKIYFIQVESGQRQNFNLTFPKVDWRHATGSYELLVNSMSNLNFADDHVNGPAPNVQATPIPINLDTTSTTAVLGSVSGQIQNNLSNPTDTDLFNFLAPASGTARITVSVANGDVWDRTVSVFDVNGALIGTVTGNGTTDATISIGTNQGDRFYVLVDGQGAEGHYTVSVAGIPFIDDHASHADFFDATVIDKNLYDFDKTETVTGSIESVADTDIFTFQSIAFDVATLTVHSLTANFFPSIRVYEIGEDNSANPVLLTIGFNTSQTGEDAVIQFSVTAPPRISGSSGISYTNYFAVVSGADPEFDKGDYTMRLDVNVATDDHPDAGQYTLADPISLTPNLSTFVASGSSAGVIELTGDTDLFKFTSPSQGLSTVTITSPATSLLLPRVRIFDSNGQIVSTITSAQSVTGSDQLVSTAVFQFTALRNAEYFIQVEGVTSFGNIFKTADTGAYTVNVAAPVPDDHPNIGEFTIADAVTLSPFSGDGSTSGQLEFATDTDLFKFTTVADGDVVVSIISPLNSFRPFLRLFDGATAEIGAAVRDGGPGDEDGQLNGAVTRTIHGATTGHTYYFQVSSDQTEPGNHQTGGYTVILNGPAPAHGSDDHANAGDYPNATLIPLDLTNGDGTATGNIEIPPDTDLFTFFSLSGSSGQPRKAFVQILTPNGSPLDVGVRIITVVNGTHTQIVADTAGGPGVNALVSFDIDAANKQYWIEVDGIANTGSYTVVVDTQPNTFFLYYPEGFANQNIREYVAIGNDNSFPVSYTVRLKYEDPNIPDQTITRVIPAHSRGGETISDGTANPASHVIFNKPYAIIIESDGFLGANLSHYDFGNTLGEAFTGKTSTEWDFAKGDKFHGQVNDFLIYYNPNPDDVRVTLTIYQTDPNTHAVSSIAMAQVVHGFHRLGWDFDNTALIPTGEFAFTVTSAPVNPGDPHIGIVAALSHYDHTGSSVGYAVLGNPDPTAESGIIPGLISTATSSPFVTFYNNSSSPSTIGLIGKYTGSGLPDLVKPITLAPHESRTYDAVGLGLVANQTVGLRYDANTAVTVLAATIRAGDADGTQANTDAGTNFFFGDAFINKLKAGTLYFEDLYFYNPDTTALPVTLTFQYTNGTVTSYSFNIAPKDFGHVALHQLAAALVYNFNWFSIKASAARPFAVSMTHYDLVLAGGWGTKGAPLGPTVSIDTV